MEIFSQSHACAVLLLTRAKLPITHDFDINLTPFRAALVGSLWAFPFAAEHSWSFICCCGNTCFAAFDPTTCFSRHSDRSFSLVHLRFILALCLGTNFVLCNFLTLIMTRGGFGSTAELQSVPDESISVLAFSEQTKGGVSSPTIKTSTDAELEKAWRTLPPSSGPKLPWQTGIWPSVFGRKRPLVANKNLERPSFVQAPLSSRTPVGQPAKKRSLPIASSWTAVVSNLDVASWEETREALLDKALKRWLLVFEKLPDHVEIARQIKAEPSVQKKLRMVRDVVAGKAPQTLIKRVNSLTRYLEHLHKLGRVFPGSEQTFFIFFG